MNLLKLTLEELLNKFGAGSHKPGSGSAAAMLGLISCKMTQTVIKLTLERDAYKLYHEEMDAASKVIKEEIEPILKDSLQEDAIQFDIVIKARRERDKEGDILIKSQLEDVAFLELRKATLIPIKIAEKCIKLAKIAIKVFDNGFQSARGDSAVAINSALSGASGAVSIAYLNLTSYWGDDWALDITTKVDELSEEVRSLQKQLSQRIQRLRNEAKKANSPFELNLDEFKVKQSGSFINNNEIERQVRKLQNLLWEKRRNIWKESTPKNFREILNPEVLIQLFGYNFSKEATLGVYTKDGEAHEIAGLIDRENHTVGVLSTLPNDIQKFTIAHELGHLLLHRDQITLHRDKPMNGLQTEGRDRIEIEADKFAVYFLMPEKEVKRHFKKIFKQESFILNQDTAFALGAKSENDIRKKFKTKREFCRLLSKQSTYHGMPIESLAEYFNVSVEAMAIRLEELDLVVY